jgi:hypothetical protein
VTGDVEQKETEETEKKLCFLSFHFILILYPMTPQFEFHRQALFVNRFQQSWSFIFVDFNCCADYVVSQFRC